MIYFDNAATSFIKPDVVKYSVYNALKTLTANPGRSGHFLSINVAKEIFETRENLKIFLKASNFNVIFTKNCTEALNFAIFGSLNEDDEVITTCYEHNSVLRPLYELKKKNVNIKILDCDLKDFSTEVLKEISEKTKMIISTYVSNVTGDVCDVEAVGKICKEKGIIYLVDGAQAAGHININLDNSNIDMFAFAGHKGFLSLTGVGGLLVRKGINLKPMLFGGTGTESSNLNQPINSIEGYEAGTLPSISIISLNAGLRFLRFNEKIIYNREKMLSKYFYEKISNLKFVTLYSTKEALNVFSFNLNNFDPQYIANELNDKFKICVRAGLHCAPLIHKKLGTDNRGAIRVSLDFNNTKEEIDFFVQALCYIYQVNLNES